MGNNVCLIGSHEPTGIKAYGNAGAKTVSVLRTCGGKLGVERCGVDENESPSLKPLAEDRS